MRLRLPSEQQHQYNGQEYEYAHYLERKQTEEDIIGKLNQIKGKPYTPRATPNPAKVNPKNPPLTRPKIDRRCDNRKDKEQQQIHRETMEPHAT
jgi:hypothetical protein